MRSTATAQVLSNTITGWFALATRAMLSLALVPLLLQVMGREAYGLLGLMGAVISLSFATDLGLRAALSREMAEANATNNRQQVNALASSAMMMFVGVGTVLGLLLWAVAPRLVMCLRVPVELRSAALALFRCYAVPMLLLSFIRPVFTSVISARNRFDLINTPEAVCGALGCVVLFTVIGNTSHPLAAWAVTLLAAQLLLLVVLALIAMRIDPGLRIVPLPRYFDRGCVRKLARLGAGMYLLQVTNILAERTDPFVVSLFHGPGGVALYKPGSRLSELLRPAVLTLASQLQPLATRHVTLRQKDRVQRILTLGTRYTLLLGVPACLLLLAAAEPFCRLWLQPSLGEDYRVAAVVMQAWALVDLFAYAGGSQWAVLLAMKRLKFVIWTQVPAAILNLAVSVYLVGYTSLGIPGVLLATVLIGALRRPILSAYSARVCGLTPGQYFREAYRGPLLGAIPVALCVAIGNAWIGSASWLQLIAYLAVLGCVALASMAYLMITATERRMFGQLVVDRLQRRR